MTTPETVPTVSTKPVLEAVTSMVVEILDTYGVADNEIDMETTFHDDLEMESIDMVTLATMLVGEFGDQVNLAEFLAEKTLTEVINLTVGDIVNYVVDRTGRS